MKFAVASIVSALAVVSSVVANPALVARTSKADINTYLKDHNTLRAKHDAKALKWDNKLAAAAQKWVNRCVFEHSGGKVGPYGENLSAGSGAYTITDAINGWAKEESQYNPANPQYSHYTQMVWKGTTAVGCAVATCAPGKIFPAEYGSVKFYACEYSPPGNVIGQFAKNVS